MSYNAFCITIVNCKSIIMKANVIFFFLLGSVGVFAQPGERTQQRTFDFTGIDLQTINTENLRRQYDSLFRKVKLDSIQQLLNYHYREEYSRDYVAYSFGLFGQRASLNGLNKSLKEAGMESMNDNFLAMPIGLHIKTGRLVMNYVGHVIFRNKVEDEARKLDARGFTFEMGLGYDVINSKRFQLYPQASLAYQTFHVKAVNREANTTISQVDQLFSQVGNTSLVKRSLLINYGVEADYFVSQFKNGSGIILGLQYGMSTTIAPGKFKMEKRTSAIDMQHDRIRTSYFGVIVKFALKNF
jgi:hypothetical protein